MADGYLDLELGRYNYLLGRTRKIRVKGKRPEGTGNLRIETDPPGATITFNDIPVADKTPLTFTNQPAGTHSISIEKSGYGTLVETVTIEKDKTTTRSFTLRKEYAGLKVTSDPDGANVFMDDEMLGTTPLDRDDLSPGEGMLTVELEGYAPQTQPVRLKTDYKPTIALFLVLQTGSIEVTTIPPGAEIFLDGVSIGVVQDKSLVRDKLSLGNHQLRATKNGYGDASQQVTVEFNKTASIQLTLEGETGASGALLVTTTPWGASIIIDNKDTGELTSSMIRDLTPGQHLIRLKMDGHADFVEQIIINPGRTTTLSATLSGTYSGRSGRSGSSEDKDQYLYQYGIQLFKFGKINNTHFTGIAIPVYSGTGRYERFSGIDIGNFGAPFSNFTPEGSTTQFKGLAISLLSSCVVNFKGVQVAMMCNITLNKHEILQLGMVNYARELHGVQIGFVNVAKSLNGLQLGFICYGGDSNLTPLMVGFNLGFSR
ncbi:MAG: PEGA domain-containing protein [Calditrichaeota bacterium]|nr:PEGA domain-containing protein [Calditrichota bacterium]